MLLRVLPGLPSADFWKKTLKKIHLDFWPKFTNFLRVYSMVKKIGQNGDDERRSNFGLKLNVHVQYNMLRPIWPAPVA